MSEAILEVGIDATGAERGARRVSRSLKDVEDRSNRLEGSFRRVEGGTVRVRRSLDGMTSSLGTIRSHMQQLNPLMGAFGSVLTAAGIQRFTQNTLNMADALDKTASRVGVNVEALQELRHAGELAGVQNNVLEMGLQRLTRRVGEAAQGQGDLVATLEQYGVAIRDANGRTRDTVDILSDLADVIQGAESDAERLRIAVKAFDSEAAGMVNLLREGSGALNDMRAEARELGLVLDDDLVTGASRLNTEMTKLNNVIRVNLQQGLLRTLVTDTNDLSDIYTDQTFHEGLRIVASLIGAIGREALATATSLGSLAKFFRSGDLDALGNVGLLGVSRRMLEAFGLLGDEADNAKGPVSGLGKAMRDLMDDASSGLSEVQKLLKSLDGKGSGGGGGGSGMADRVGDVVTALERQNERLSLMQQAMEQGQDAVEGLNTAFAIHDELLAAGVVPNTMALHEAMALTSEGADENARAIGVLVKENVALERSLEKTRTAQERARKAANDNSRAQAEAMRQQAAPMQAVAPEVAEYAADLLAAIFAEEAAA